MLPDMIGRPMAAFAATRLGTKVYRTVLPPLDHAVRRMSGGKRTFTALVLPTLMLTTTGRRSGEPRVQPLVFLRIGIAFAVVGSNWGQDHHPAWTHNLIANPEAEVEVRGSLVPVRARLLEGDERAEVYTMFEAISPNYSEYPEWAGDREIRVFVLEPR